jgi:hypothetical protein
MTGTGHRIIIIIVSLMIIVTGCLCTRPDNNIQPSDVIKHLSKQESQKIAEDFIRNSPTFSYDGISKSLSLKETFTSNCPSCWVFIFEFECRDAGYGNRSGQDPARVVTPHKATIVIQQGEIKAADLDGKWDMLKQKSFE